jgi:uncharacterized protein (TIGR03086 family)
MSDVITNHRSACSGFSAIVAQGEGSWRNPSPCSEWDARGVVEHVIGFHDELLLRPTGIEPVRPEDDPVARWALTVPAIRSAVETASSKDLRERPVPAEVDLDQLLPALTAEVLTHTWDLAKAIGVDPHLDPELCQVSYDFMRANEAQVRSSVMFGAAVSRPNNTDAVTQLIAILGRDPGWTPSRTGAENR